MTGLQWLVVSSLATLIIVFHAPIVAFLSNGPAALALLGMSLMLLAHQLRRRLHKTGSREATGH